MTRMLALLLCACAAPGAPALRMPHGAGSCGAVAIGPHEVVTAEHCLSEGAPVGCEVAERYACDVALLRCTQRMLAWVGVSAALHPGADVDVAVVGGPQRSRVLAVDGCAIRLSGAWRYGDSGSGVFDDGGRLVGVMISREVDGLAGWAGRVPAGREH